MCGSTSVAAAPQARPSPSGTESRARCSSPTPISGRPSSPTACSLAIRACASARNTASRAPANVSSTANAEATPDLRAPLVQSGGVFLFLIFCQLSFGAVERRQLTENEKESCHCRRLRLLRPRTGALAARSSERRTHGHHVAAIRRPIRRSCLAQVRPSSARENRALQRTQRPVVGQTGRTGLSRPAARHRRGVCCPPA